jgi:hypothetical protein
MHDKHDQNIGAQGRSRVAQGAGAIGAAAPLGRDVRFAVVARHAPWPPLACRGMAALLSDPSCEAIADKTIIGRRSPFS